MRRRVTLVFLAAAAAVTPTRVLGQTLPRMLKSPLAVNIDWQTGKGTSTIYLRNDRTEAAGCVLSAAVVGAGPSSRTVIAFQDADTKGIVKPSGETTLPMGTTALTVSVANALDVSETDAAVFCDSTEIGKLRLWRPTFGITLDNQAEALTLPLVHGQDARIVLKNEDPVTYTLGWTLLVGGRQIAKADTVPVQPKGPTILAFTPTIEFGVRDLFKETAAEGELLLYPSDTPDTAASPVRRFPVHATLSFLSPAARDAWGYLAIIAILVAGGVASLILSHALPNQLQRLDVREKLTTTGRATTDLTTNVKSRLSVLAAVERTRLKDLLATRTVISPDFAHVLAQVTTGVDNLSTRVGILQQIDVVLGRLWQLAERSLPPPPTRCDQVVGVVEKVQVLLQKAEPTQNEIQAAQAAATAAATLVDVLDQPNAEFEQTLAKRVEDILATVDRTISQLSTFTRINTAVPGPLMVLRAVTTGAPIPHDRCPDVDMAAQKVALMASYVRLAEGTTDPAMLRRRSEHEPTLLGYLQLDSLAALRSAHLLMREMKEDIYPGRIEEALRAKPIEASISMDPRIAYERSPLTFCVCFASSAVNDSAARAEWTCDWDFGDGLTESGNNVSHYFTLPTKGRLVKRSVAKTFVVQATLRGPTGRAVLDDAGAPLVVSRSVDVLPTRVGDLIGQRSIIEGLKLAAALFVAVFALVSGAKDQLLKLDLLPGLVAVFVIGFTADTVKNLLTQK